MQLEGIVFENFTSYKQEEKLINFGNIAILIGPNNAGKSNIIQSLRLYLDLVKQRFNTASRIEFNHLFFESEKPLHLAYEFLLNKSERDYLFEKINISENIKESLRNSLFLTRILHSIRISQIGIYCESLSITDQTGEWINVYTLSNNKDHNFKIDFSKPIENIELNNLTKIYYNDYFRYPFSFCVINGNSFFDFIGLRITKYTQKWILFDPIRDIKNGLEPRDQNLISSSGEDFLRIYQTHIQNYDLITTFKNKLITIIPELQSIKTKNPRGQIEGYFDEISKTDLPIDLISSGSKQLIILLFILLSYPRNSLFAIEEPEIHLHAKAQRYLFNLIQKISKDNNSKFIMTTHSTIFSKLSDEVHTYLVTKKENGSRIQKLENNNELLIVKQSLGHENTDLFGYNGLVIIEGETEERIIPLLLHNLEIDFVDLGIKIYNAGGSGKVTLIEKLVEYLKDSDTEIFCILDNHSENISTMRNLIRRNLIKNDNIYYIEKGFEDEFEIKDLALALEKIGNDKGIIMKFSVSEIEHLMDPNKSIGHVLKRLVYEKTQSDLSKPLLGEKIIQTTDKETIKKAKISTILKEIENKMNSKNSLNFSKI
jgi:predicted ATP-dependent endonuclease of OLD family